MKVWRKQYIYFIPVVYYLLLLWCLNKVGQINVEKVFTVVSVLPLAVIALFQDEFKRWWLAPKLGIEFKLQPPYCLKTPTSNGDFAYYFRFRVKNIGMNQARLCECVAEDFWALQDNKTWKKYETFQPINLSWSNAKSKDEFMDINPECPGWFCDLVHIDHWNLQKLKIDFKQPVPFSQIDGIIPNSKCRIKVSIYSENAKPISKIFEISWSGAWRDRREEMFNEIAISV
jgi:hypothetical protein